MLFISVYFTVFSRPKMDFRAQDDTWLLQLDEICNDGGLNGALTVGGNTLSISINELKDLIRKRTRLWWNIAFLRKYIEKGLIPRGLRVQIFPSFNIDDDTIKNRWEQYSNTCSIGYMNLLIEINQISLSTIETQIEKLQLSFKNEMTADSLKKLNEDIEALAQKWAKETQQAKTKKFQRDTQDKSLQKVYKWDITRGRSRPFQKHKSQSRSRSTSVSSFTSTEETHDGPQAANNHGVSASGTKRIQTRLTSKNRGLAAQRP
ncbi:uncharacterized protein [Phyllobates terribilis]|uniref:uncharacterized protein n=1 Tax=Phyllobates terribilis TaxID=111132 RepID=UPI003CCB52A9